MATIDLGKIAITPEGKWSAGKYYEKLSLVIFNGQSYLSLRDTTGDNPETSRSDWMQITSRGESLYQMMVREGKFVGTEEEFLQQYLDSLKACADASEEVRAALSDILDEMDRVRAEISEVMVEEDIRIKNEAKREAAEINRRNAEITRGVEERNRQEAEQRREQSMQQIQNDAEIALAMAAEAQQKAEEAILNEEERVSAENQRKIDEATRIQHEEQRVNDEAMRRSREADRLESENIRQKNEGDRILAEREREEIMKNLVEELKGLAANKFKIVDVLPEVGEFAVIYLVPSTMPSDNDVYDEWAYVSEKWEHIGSTRFKIDSYFTKEEVERLLATKQDTLTPGNGISIEGNVISSSVAEVVDNIVNAGYVFAGVATPATDPSTPNAKVFYIANGKGTYTNFGGVSVTEDEVVILKYDTAWHKVSTGIASQAKLSELELKINESKQETKEDGFYVTDEKGNVICRIDSDSIEALDFGDNLKQKILDTINSVDNPVVNTEEDGFYVTDEKGNVVIKYDGKFDSADVSEHLKNEIIGRIRDNESLIKSYNHTYAEVKKMKLETQRLLDSVSFIKDADGNTFVKTITIPMSQASKDMEHAVLKLGLHYGNKLGTDTRYDVFFGGNVKKDFSDVRVKDANGNILRTSLLHCGNYEVVRDDNLGDSAIVMDANRDLYRIIGGKIYKSSTEFRTSQQLPNQTHNAVNDTLFIDSKGGLWYNCSVNGRLKVYVCYPQEGSYDFANEIEALDFTISNGVDNTKNQDGTPAINVKLTENGIIEDSAGYIYIGQYQLRKNPVIFRSINPLGNNGIVATSGSYFKEAYHQEIVLLPDGTVDAERTDQHVHHLHTFVAKDANGNNVDNIIAGLDSGNSKGANLISSIDHGETWISFREILDTKEWIQQHSRDYALTDISADHTYAFCHGEGDILGGMTTYKMYTKVDAQGRITPTGLAFPVNLGQGTRSDNMTDESFILNAFLASEISGNTYNLVVSEDKGKTWKSIFQDYHLKSYNTAGAGDGARWIKRFRNVANGAECNDICWYATGQTTGASNNAPLRIYKGNEHYYGEILVELGKLKAGVDVTITVESGYAFAQPNADVLAVDIIKPIWSLPLIEGTGNIVIDSDGLKHKIVGDYEWDGPDNTKRIFQYLPLKKDFENMTGGIKLSVGSYIELGKIAPLKFRKGFSVLIWLAYGDYDGFVTPNREYENAYYPIINSQEFNVGFLYYYNGYTGGKKGGSFAYGNIQSAIDKTNVKLYKPYIFTYSNEDIPLVKCYYSDRSVSTFKKASSWLNKDICDIALKVGTEKTEYGMSMEINRNCYIGSISFYDKELSEEDVRTILNGRSITDDYNNILNK